jgi:hypothetical protein
VAVAGGWARSDPVHWVVPHCTRSEVWHLGCGCPCRRARAQRLAACGGLGRIKQVQGESLQPPHPTLASGMKCCFGGCASPWTGAAFSGCCFHPVDAHAPKSESQAGVSVADVTVGEVRGIGLPVDVSRPVAGHIAAIRVVAEPVDDIVRGPCVSGSTAYAGPIIRLKVRYGVYRPGRHESSPRRPRAILRRCSCPRLLPISSRRLSIVRSQRTTLARCGRARSGVSGIEEVQSVSCLGPGRNVTRPQDPPGTGFLERAKTLPKRRPLS